jgi:hypothetical protein
VKDAVNTVVETCFSMILRDEPWRDFGFAKRPRYGSFFQKFRSVWRTSLEKRVIQEMLATFTAAHVLAERISPQEIPAAIAIYAENQNIVTALGYPSREAAVHHLTSSIADYLSRPVSEWHALVLQRLDVIAIPDKKLSARLLVGSITFAQTVGDMILLLKRNAAGPDD